MTKSTHQLSSTLLVCALLITSATSIAQDNDRSGGYLKIGAGYESYSGPINKGQEGFNLFVNGRYQWQNGLFVELPDGSKKLDPGLTVGYQLYQTDDWDFDLIAARVHGELVYGFNTPDVQIASEKGDTKMIGIRSTGYFGDTSIRMTVMPYSFNHDYDNGLFGSLWLAHSWQLKNWHINAAIGAQYRSENIMDFYYSVPSEFRAVFGDYQAGSAINATAQVGLIYPITPDWVFESFYRYTKISDTISNNPLVAFSLANDESRSKNESHFGMMINYVF